MFRVFGVTRSHAEAIALKKVKRHTGRGASKVELTDEQYQAKLEAEIQKQMQTANPKQMSHDLSTPAICREYMSLIKEEARMVIKQRVPSEANAVGRKPKMEWIVYGS